MQIYHDLLSSRLYTVGFGVTPNHTLRLVGYTTGRESHPALKIILIFYYFIMREYICQIT